MRSTEHLARCCVCLALEGLPAATWAQATGGTAPSQVTPQNLRPTGRAAAEAVQIPRVPENLAPPGSEGLFVIPGGFVVGAESPQLLKLAAGYALPPPGTRVSVADLFAIAAQLELAYARAGYPLVRVALPAQSVVDGGTVRFSVIDGFIESVDVQALPAAARELVLRRLQPLISARELTLAQLERRLLLAGATPGLSLRSTLAAGDSPGGTTLILDGRHAAVTGSLSADNRLGAALRRWQAGPTVAVNSALGYGEQFYATLRSGERVQDTFGSDPLLRIMAAGVELPLGNDGASLSVEFTDSRTHAVAAPGVVDAIGQLRRATLRGAYPLLLGRAGALNLSLALEQLAQSSHAPQFGVDISNDRYLALRGTLDGTMTLPSDARLAAALTLSAGLGGRDASDVAHTGVPLSRQGADPSFRKLGLALQVRQPLPLERLNAELSLAGQSGFRQPLLQSEQFSLDGSSLVSGVPSGAFSVDSGAAVRLELQRSLPVAWGEIRSVLTPYGFAAYGRGRLERPTSVESSRVVGRVYGLGLRCEAAGASGTTTHSLTLEWARQHSYGTDLPAGQRGTLIYSLLF